MGVDKIFSRYAEVGLFTHAYCALGTLGRDLPDFEFTSAQDSRTIFDLASLTKALVTTPLIFFLSEKIKKPINASVGYWLTGIDHKLDPKLCAIKVEDLLAHTSGLSAWRNLWVCQLGTKPDSILAAPDHRRQLIVEKLNQASSTMSVRGTDVYSDLGFILLGHVVELLSNSDLAGSFRDLKRKITADNLPTLSFGCELKDTNSFVPTSFCALRQRQLIGEVHDENCAALGGIAGHAGLFGSGRDVGAYLNALCRSDLGRVMLQENANRRVLPITNPPNASLMGWRQGADATSQPFGSGAAIGHMGFTGVAFWLWPERDRYVILLTNRVISGRQTPGIAQMRREVFSELAAM